jgi:hypothetical protein
MKRNCIAIAALLALGCVQSNAYAQDSVGPTVKISGFGTGALTWTDTNDAEFATPGQGFGAGKTPRTGPDSNLGLQVDAQVNDWLSLTGQGLVRKAADDYYGAYASLAFAKFKLSDEFSVRVGRLPMAIFMMSDYRHVGYSNVMLRPSQEVYSQVPMDTVDGADVTWQKSFGGTTVTSQVSYGRSNSPMPFGGKATVSNSSVENLVVEHGPFTFRISHNNADLTLDAPYFKLPKTKVSFTGAGLGLDWNNVVVQSELTRANGVGVPSTGWYVMGGYRFGKLLPFVSHGKLTGLNGQSSNSAGLRWDAFQSADIKFQVDRVETQGPGTFVNAKPGFHGPVTVAAVAVDFVF